MKKMIAAAVTAVFAVSMVSTAFADDVVVRTSVGSGEVVFTETSEAADISSEDLTALVKKGIKSLNENEVFNGFLDAEASVSLKIGEQNAMTISGSSIDTFNKNGDTEYASAFYALEGLGTPQSAKYEAYHWVKDDVHYTAHSKGDGWTVETEDFVTAALEKVSEFVDSEEAAQISLDGALPNLYEENGDKYYVCLYDKDTVMKAFGNVKGTEMYASMADGFLGDNNLKLVVVVNAESGLLRAVSLDASGAAGQIPGELLGAEGALDYSAEDLYVTLLMDTVAQSIEVPEEVLNTPVAEDKGLDLDIGSLLNGLGIGGGTQ